MKFVGLLLLLLATSPLSAQTNQTQFCCRHPLRVFGNDTTVNLTPLFQWWKHHANDNEISGADDHLSNQSASTRPLVAWQRITGTKSGSLEYSWYVNATVYSSPGQHTNEIIILKNPPTAEAQLFSTLKSEIAAATLQLTNDQRTYEAELKAAQKAETHAQAENRVRKERARNNGNRLAQQVANDKAAATTTLNQQQQMEASLTQAQKQFSAIPAVKGKYQIDWFAVELGRNKQGVPVFDVGVVPVNSP